MRVTLRQLNVFESVARNSSFTRAAEELHLTQPAVSMQIKQLEENIGLVMFEHLGKKIYLTEPGVEMYTYSRRISQLLREADAVLADFKGLKRGHLSISVATTANTFATRLLADFLKRFDGVTFSLDVTNRETLLQQLENNERDLIIMGEPPSGIDLMAEPFMENPLVIIAPSDHPLVGESAIRAARMANESFVMREQGSGTRNAIERFFKTHGLQLHAGMEMSSNEAIKQAVEAGLGLGIVSIHTLELELEFKRIVILDVEGFPIVRHWYVVQLKNIRLSPIAQAFKEFVLAKGDQFVRLPEKLMPPSEEPV